MTDMTYERRPVGNAPNGQPDSYWQMLFPYAAWIDVLIFSPGRHRPGRLRDPRADGPGAFLGLVAVVFGAWACIWPQSHLWNARLLPFMYLARYLLAFIGVYEVVALVVRHLRLELRDGAARTPSEDRRFQLDPPGRRAGLADRGVGAWARSCSWAWCWRRSIYGGIHFQRGLPFASFGVHDGKTTYDWLFFRGTKSGFVDDWARWNYAGYEGKSVYGEFQSIVGTMQELGEERGCGRALWEHQTGNDVSSYGTPMALMLLPYFTDGCIGSMEGLYFEASGTTPYHFLTAAAGSKQASNPVRRLAYDNNDVDLAVRYMQDLGIRYYLAFRPEAVAQADANPDLTALRQVGPWTIYEVADSDLVVPAHHQPGRGGGHGQRAAPVAPGPRARALAGAGHELVPASRGLGRPAGCRRTVRVAAHRGRARRPGDRQQDAGPARSGRNDRAVHARHRSRSATCRSTDNSISFSVDQVGVPVLVKASYFPNWSVEGADGPYRVAPNFMVVVPTANQVTLTYGTSWVEYLGYALTLLGLVLLVVLWRKGPVRYEAATAAPYVAGRGAALARRARIRLDRGVPRPNRRSPTSRTSPATTTASRCWPIRSSGRRSTEAPRAPRPRSTAAASAARPPQSRHRHPLRPPPLYAACPHDHSIRSSRRTTSAARCRISSTPTSPAPSASPSPASPARRRSSSGATCGRRVSSWSPPSPKG